MGSLIFINPPFSINQPFRSTICWPWRNHSLHLGAQVAPSCLDVDWPWCKGIDGPVPRAPCPSPAESVATGLGPPDWEGISYDTWRIFAWKMPGVLGEVEDGPTILCQLGCYPDFNAWVCMRDLSYGQTSRVWFLFECEPASTPGGWLHILSQLHSIFML